MGCSTVWHPVFVIIRILCPLLATGFWAKAIGAAGAAAAGTAAGQLRTADPPAPD